MSILKIVGVVTLITASTIGSLTVDSMINPLPPIDTSRGVETAASRQYALEHYGTPTYNNDCVKEHKALLALTIINNVNKGYDVDADTSASVAIANLVKARCAY